MIKTALQPLTGLIKQCLTVKCNNQIGLIGRVFQRCGPLKSVLQLNWGFF